jgi:hypothetical protein
MIIAALQNLRRRLCSPAILAPLALGLIFVLALVFRLSDLAARDLWTDEAWVALAALKASPGAALVAGHSTPPFYLLTVWALAKVMGGQEWVLRFLSFSFGAGTLLFLWLLARRLTSRPIALLALAAAAFSPVMVYYSKELKQYSGDAFFALLVVYLAERLRRGGGRGVWLALAATGVLGLGFSHPLVFVLPAAGLILWLSLPAARGRLILLAALWALAFGCYYILFFRHDMDPELVAYWAQDYPNFSSVWPFFYWLGGALYRYFWYFLGEWGVFWGPPLVLAFGAAALHRYPFMAHYGGNRLMLFSAPLLYLVAAAGAGLALAWLWQGRRRWLAAGLTAVLLIALHPWDNLREYLHPEMNREEISPLVTRLEREIGPRDLVYVYYFAQWPFEYYYKGPEGRICIGKSCVETGLHPDVQGGAPPRLWLIASHILNLKQMRKFAGKLLGPEWRETACYQQDGAVLFCFRNPAATGAANGRGQPPGPPGYFAATPSGERVYK